jgi:hypothetical protein
MTGGLLLDSRFRGNDVSFLHVAKTYPSKLLGRRVTLEFNPIQLAGVLADNFLRHLGWHSSKIFFNDL